MNSKIALYAKSISLIANQQGDLIFLLAGQQRNQVIGLFSSVFGSLLLLSANLIAEIGEAKKGS